MQDFLQYRDRIVKISALLAAALVFAFAQGGRMDIAFGLALGGAWSITRFWLRAHHLKKSAEGKDMGKSVRYTLGGSFGLYALTGVVLSISFVVKGINPWAALAGLFIANAVMVAYEGLGHVKVAFSGHSHHGER